MKNEKLRINIILYYIISLCIIYFIFVEVFYCVLYFDKNFLIQLFDKFNVYKNLPFTISHEDILKISNELMDFLIDKRTFLETTININNNIIPLYSVTAKIHMGDVKNLFQLIINLHYIALSIALFLIILLKNNKDFTKKIFTTYKKTILFISIFIFIILILGFINFYLFFTLFQKVLFNNDYYLFNPNVDFIILLLPEEFLLM